MHTLTPREEKVMPPALRAGRTGRPHTLEEVGKEFDVTRERIRQIEVQSAAQAAPPRPVARKLRDYYTE